jgi:hypothetical protein
MNQFDKKRLNKIAIKIESLAKGGNISLEEYKEYIDEIVNDGQWWIFQELLNRKYKLKDYYLISPVDAKNERVWDVIRLATNSDYQKSLKLLFDNNDCYQMGRTVISATNSSTLGDIWLDTVIGLTNSIDYNAVIAKKGNEIQSWDNISLPILDRYQSAITFLIS